MLSSAGTWIAGNMTFSQLFMFVGRLRWKQHNHKFPITRKMVCDALSIQPTIPTQTNVTQFRNKRVLVVGTFSIMSWFNDDVTKELMKTPRKD
jgi:hypothetical protein